MLPVLKNPDFLPFQFEGMRLQEACFLNGNPYFTGRGIGEFLEYEHPDRAIHKIVERNPHIKEFSTLVNLTIVDEYPKGHSFVKLTNESTERNREIEVRVYDPVGLQLIINKSNQPRALAFQIAAAHLVMAFMKGEIKPSKWATKGDRVSAIKQILSHPPTYKRRELVEDLAQKERVSLQTVYRWLEQSGGIKTHKGVKRQRSTKGAHIMPGEAQKIKDTANTNPHLTNKDIWKKSGTAYSYGHVNMILRGPKTVH